jgi:hypothetical protein
MHAPVTRFIIAPATNTLDYPGNGRQGKRSIAPDESNKTVSGFGVRNKRSSPVDHRSRVISYPV